MYFIYALFKRPKGYKATLVNKKIETFNGKQITYMEFNTDKEREQEVIFKEEQFSFSDTSGAVSEFSGGYIDANADFLNGTFDVQVGYVDELNLIDNINLVLYDIELGEEQLRTYPLIPFSAGKYMITSFTPRTVESKNDIVNVIILFDN